MINEKDRVKWTIEWMIEWFLAGFIIPVVYFKILLSFINNKKNVQRKLLHSPSGETQFP